MDRTTVAMSARVWTPFRSNCCSTVWGCSRSRDSQPSLRMDKTLIQINKYRQHQITTPLINKVDSLTTLIPVLMRIDRQPQIQIQFKDKAIISPHNLIIRELTQVVSVAQGSLILQETTRSWRARSLFSISRFRSLSFLSSTWRISAASLQISTNSSVEWLQAISRQMWFLRAKLTKKTCS